VHSYNRTRTAGDLKAAQKFLTKWDDAVVKELGRGARSFGYDAALVEDIQHLLKHEMGGLEAVPRC